MHDLKTYQRCSGMHMLALSLGWLDVCLKFTVNYDASRCLKMVPRTGARNKAAEIEKRRSDYRCSQKIGLETWKEHLHINAIFNPFLKWCSLEPNKSAEIVMWYSTSSSYDMGCSAARAFAHWCNFQVHLRLILTHKALGALVHCCYAQRCVLETWHIMQRVLCHNVPISIVTDKHDAKFGCCCCTWLQWRCLW